MDQWSCNERLDNHRACDIMTPTIRNISSVVAEDECGRVRNLDATNSGLAMIPLPPNETSIHSFDGSFDGYSGGCKLDSGSEHNTMSSPTILHASLMYIFTSSTQVGRRSCWCPLKPRTESRICKSNCES